jgi:flagellar basal-body rod protein FlgF
MDSGLYLACSGLVARTSALEIAAHDLANVNTTAYRGQHPSFETVLAASSNLGSSTSRSLNQQPTMARTQLDMAQGQLQRTGQPYDLAIEGRGFFVVQTPNGTEYTRNGNFHVSKGTLVTEDGSTVMSEQGPIRVVSGQMNISEDGTVSVNGALAGKLRTVEFAPDVQLVSQSDSRYSAPAAAAKPATGTRVRQGMLEGSNVSAVEAAVGLIALQRHAEMLQRAMAVFHSEFNKAAVEDLPRI